MKTEAMKFAREQGFPCAYSGKTKTMYFKYIEHEQSVLNHFGYGLSIRLSCEWVPMKIIKLRRRYNNIPS